MRRSSSVHQPSRARVRHQSMKSAAALSVALTFGLSAQAANAAIVSQSEIDGSVVTGYTSQTITQQKSTGQDRVQTDLGLNRVSSTRSGATEGNGFASMWGENFSVSGGGSSVTLTFSLRVDGNIPDPFLGEIPEDFPDEARRIPEFNYFFKAIAGRADGFSPRDEGDDPDDFEDVVVYQTIGGQRGGILVDGDDRQIGAPVTLLGSAFLCPVVIVGTNDASGCGAGSYDKTLTLSFTVDSGSDFFVFGALMMEDMTSGVIDFFNTAELTGIAVSDGAVLTSDSGRLVQSDGVYLFGPAEVPEPAALSLLGLGVLGLAALRRRRV